MDRNGDGRLSRQELRAMLESDAFECDYEDVDEAQSGGPGARAEVTIDGIGGGVDRGGPGWTGVEGERSAGRFGWYKKAIPLNEDIEHGTSLTCSLICVVYVRC